MILTMKKNMFIAAAIAVAALALTGCSSDADTAARNISVAAENFEVERHITVINAITDSVILEVEGRCSVETAESALGNSLEITCKVNENEYRKSFVILSDNITASVEQLAPIDVSVYNYRYIVKPQSVIPDINVSTDNQ